MDKIPICPNCGKVLKGPEFLTSVSVMTQQVGLNFDPVSGRFLCPDCNYSGLPIEMTDDQLKTAKFENKKISTPLERANPGYFQLIFLGVVLFFLAGVFLVLNAVIMSTIMTISAVLVLIYGMFGIKKFK